MTYERKFHWLTAIVVGLAILTFFCGCANFSSTVTQTDALGNKSTTTVTVNTLFESKTDLAKFLAHTTGRTNGVYAQSIGLASLQQETTSTNLNDIISAVVSAAVKAAKP